MIQIANQDQHVICQWLRINIVKVIHKTSCRLRGGWELKGRKQATSKHCISIGLSKAYGTEY